MQKEQGLSKTKFILIAVLVLIFSVSMAIFSLVQVSKIRSLNKTIAEQEREIEKLNSQLGEK